MSFRPSSLSYFRSSALPEQRRRPRTRARMSSAGASSEGPNRFVPGVVPPPWRASKRAPGGRRGTGTPMPGRRRVSPPPPRGAREPFEAADSVGTSASFFGHGKSSASPTDDAASARGSSSVRGSSNRSRKESPSTVYVRRSRLLPRTSSSSWTRGTPVDASVGRAPTLGESGPRERRRRGGGGVGGGGSGVPSSGSSVHSDSDSVATGQSGGGASASLARGPVRVSSLSLVDLAGSESVRTTGATGTRQKEGRYINKSSPLGSTRFWGGVPPPSAAVASASSRKRRKADAISSVVPPPLRALRSLLTLGQVVQKLSERGVREAEEERRGGCVAPPPSAARERQHVPYRDSKLTRLLRPSLGGNARVCVVCNVSPVRTSVEESRNTLKFAVRAKTIRQRAHITEVVDEKTLLRSYREEIE
ncbi:LOW QUALITY PROTEIN: hypothetical protein ACHAWF_000970, partial [Thalassiosira exigua]